MEQQRSAARKYHNYNRDAFRISDYSDKNRPHLKKQVHCKIGGKWARKFFKTEREAKTFVDLRRIELRNEGENGLMLPGEIRVAAIRANEQLAPFGKTIDDAVVYYLDHLRTERGTIPVRQAIDELLASRKAAGLSVIYLRDLKYRLGRFVKSFQDRNVASVRTREVAEFLQSLGVGPVTRNTFRRDVRTLFSFCVEHGYCTENPAASKATLAKERRQEVEVLTIEQARKLLEMSSRETLPYWAIGLFAGLRPSEIRKLQWTDCDFEHSLIAVRSSKTGRKRYVTMQDNLIKWLEPHRRDSGPVVDAVNFWRQYREDRRAAGWRAAGLSDWPANVVRHSFGSYWLAQFNDINALALQMGNSPAVIEEHYRQAVKPREAHRYWAITLGSVTEGSKVAGKIDKAAVA